MRRTVVAVGAPVRSCSLHDCHEAERGQGTCNQVELLKAYPWPTTSSSYTPHPEVSKTSQIKPLARDQEWICVAVRDISSSDTAVTVTDCGLHNDRFPLDGNFSSITCSLGRGRQVLLADGHVTGIQLPGFSSPSSTHPLGFACLLSAFQSHQAAPAPLLLGLKLKLS